MYLVPFAEITILSENNEGVTYESMILRDSLTALAIGHELEKPTGCQSSKLSNLDYSFCNLLIMKVNIP